MALGNRISPFSVIFFRQNAPVITLNEKVDAEAPNSTTEYMMSTQRLEEPVFFGDLTNLLVGQNVFQLSICIFKSLLVSFPSLFCCFNSLFFNSPRDIMNFCLGLLLI